MAARIGKDQHVPRQPGGPHARQTNTNAVRKVRKDFDVSNDVAQDVEAAVSVCHELRGGPDGDDLEFEQLLNRIDDIGRLVDNTIIGTDNVGRDISKLRQDNHSIINGKNILIRDAHSAVEKAIKANAFLDHSEKQDSMLSTIRDMLNPTCNATKDVLIMHISSE